MPQLAMALTCALVFVAGSPGQETAGDTSSDDAAIRSVIQKAADAWENGDGEAYGEPFAEDADYVTFGGMRLRGREQIAALHQQLFDGPLAGSRLQLQIESVRFLTPDVALAHVSGGIIEAGQDALTSDRNSLQSLVLTRRDGKWQVAGCQVTRIQAMPPGPRNPGE